MAWTGTESRSDAGHALSRGTSQSGVRLYNERLVLSLVRHHRGAAQGGNRQADRAFSPDRFGHRAPARIQRSPQARTPQRGKVGQPLVPFTLNPEGAYAIGLKLGRRSADLMLLDLTGRVCATLRQPYRYPVPAEIVSFTESGVKLLTKGMTRSQVARIAGLGIAAPFKLWNWSEAVGAPPGALDVWQGFDLGAAIAARVEWPVHHCNDATAACAAELLFGNGRSRRDYAYFYVGFFIGGGIVINGGLHQGRSGNAGALGSLLVPSRSDGAQQLILSASPVGSRRCACAA